MTAHELARKLLEGPDLVVAVEDGRDPSDRAEVVSIETLTEKIFTADGKFKEQTFLYLND